MKKVLALLMACLMVCMLFTACGTETTGEEATGEKVIKLGVFEPATGDSASGGKKEMLGVSISPDAVDMDDLEMLEDLIMAAYNDAAEQADELSQEKLGKFGNIGGLM